MNLTYFRLNSDKCTKYKLSKIGIFLMNAILRATGPVRVTETVKVCSSHGTPIVNTYVDGPCEIA